jgi:ApaG protein
MYRAETNGILITVLPRFSPEQSDPGQGQFFWIYEIEITNLTLETVQLLSRHWIITDGNGKDTHVKGNGVIGEQPVIPPGSSFSYDSGCPLTTPHGTMRGSYRMLRENGIDFLAEIPLFALQSPFHKGTLH